MSQDTSSPNRRSRLASFGIAMGALVLILAGVLLLILGSSEQSFVQAFGTTVTAVVSGLIVMGMGLVALFHSARRIKGGGDNDPESHLPNARADHLYDINGGGVMDSSYFHDGDEQ